MNPADSNPVYRTDALLRFESGVTDSAKAAFFARHDLRVMGVDPTDAYYIRFDGCGITTLDDLYQYLKSLEAEPEPKRVLSISRFGLPDIAN